MIPGETDRTHRRRDSTETMAAVPDPTARNRRQNVSDPGTTRRGAVKWLKIIAAVFGVLLALAIAAFLIWALTPLGPAPRAVSALTGDAAVSVTEDQFGWTFTPNVGQPIAGLVLYPGGRVDPRSYASLAHAFAERGVLTVITPMPLNLAVFAPGKATEVIDAYPEIHFWVVGGHSLGGAMATQYLAKNPDKADALLLLAAYPTGSVDLSDSDLLSLSMRGTRDGLVTDAEIRDSLPQLPPDARYEEIDGGNHAGFGDYGAQPNDNPATISNAKQQAAVVNAFVPMLREAASSAGN